MSTATPPNKTRTGVSGFDRMSGGGLPRGRITAVTGTAGAGKTVFAMQSLVNLVREGGTGVFVSFEQSAESIKEGLRSFDWETSALIESDRLHVMDARLHSKIVLSGTFDIAGLLASVQGAVHGIETSCIVFDGIDAMLCVLPDPAIWRTEILRLQEHAERLPSTIIMTLKAHLSGYEHFEDIALFMADCVVELERTAVEGMATRSLRIQKYRNSAHAQSRVPFIITEKGIEIAAIEPDPKQPPISNERLSTGVGRLDDMMGGGLFRASSTLLSGAPGTAKTTLGTCFLEACCDKGEPALGIFFDENTSEIMRNVASVGIDLMPHMTSGLLRLHGMVDRSAGPDEFAHEIAEQIRLHHPRHVLIDPVSIFTSTQSAQNAVRRLVQLCKRDGITVVMSSLLDRSTGESESSRSYVSTLCDNWIHLSYVLQAGERNRALTIVKSRGTSHSNQVGELLLRDDGIAIADAYTEDGAVLMGSLRWQKERENEIASHQALDEATRVEREVLRSVAELERRRTEIDMKLSDRQADLERLQNQSEQLRNSEANRRAAMSLRRSASSLSSS